MTHASKATCAFIILTLVACGSEPSTPGADGGIQETSNPPAGDATSPGEDTATPQGDAGAPQEDATAPQGDANTSGTETLAEGCCMTDDDCPEAWQMCVGEGDGSPGRCAQEPADARCYEETCPPLHICLGDVTCGCGESCDTTMGYSCMPVEGDCCEDDTECPTGGVCRAGTCVVSLGENGCWEDGDCATGEVCQGASICGCTADCDLKEHSSGYCVTEGDGALSECVTTYTKCGCPFDEMQCLDGWWFDYWYPESAGEIPWSWAPPQELLDVAVAHYDCSYCSCQENWQVRAPVVEGSEETALIDTDPVTFCVRLLEEEAQCSGCLLQWSGGAG